MSKILVTGGCGYIGGHTLVDLVLNGFEVISIDDLSRGYSQMINGASLITDKCLKNYHVNLCNIEDVKAVFEENPDIAGIIHFAAYKSVPESVSQPITYYKNNITSLLNILECAKEYGVNHFVFSSSCSVYGNADALPVTESTPLKPAESPYAATKQMGEKICNDFAVTYPNIKIALLRYFNPVGAHISSIIGELNETPENLVPVITQTAIGKRETMTVFGNDYNTIDGTCVRDYIHVMDIANAHTLAIQQMEANNLVNGSEVFNLGSGEGVSVLQLIHSFEEISGVKLNYNIGSRRSGDVVSVYADNTKARTVLGWNTKYTMHDMMETAWNWEKKLSEKNKSASLN